MTVSVSQRPARKVSLSAWLFFRKVPENGSFEFKGL